MDQPRFREGRLTTGYIAEEFPDGFHGVALSEQTLGELAALRGVRRLSRSTAAASTARAVSRASSPSHQRAVLLGDQRWQFDVTEKDGEFWLYHAGGRTLVEMNWKPGDTIARARVDGEVHILKVDAHHRRLPPPLSRRRPQLLAVLCPPSPTSCR